MLALSDDPSGKHLASFMCMLLGLLALFTFYQENLVFIVTLAVLVYPLMMLTRKMCQGRTGVAVGSVTLVYLLTWYISFYCVLVRENLVNQYSRGRMAKNLQLVHVEIAMHCNLNAT